MAPGGKGRKSDGKGSKGSKGKKGGGKGDGKNPTKGDDGNKDRKCFYRDKVGHVKSECRQKMRDDESRRTAGSQQAGLSAGEAAAFAALQPPPGIGGSPTNMRMLLVPSYSEEEFELPSRLFMLSDTAPHRKHQRVCVDSGAARSACPQDYAMDRPMVPSSNKLAFQTASGEILESYGSKTVPYDLGDFGQLCINCEVTDVDGPVAAVASMNDAGLTVVFTPEGSWVSIEAPGPQSESTWCASRGPSGQMSLGAPTAT